MANRNNTFILKRSNVVGKIPPLSGLTLGELALNTADAKLYTLYTGGLTGATEVREIGWNRLSVSGGTLYGNLNVLGSVSATTFFGSGANLINIPDTFVTGFTFSSNTLTISQNQGKLPLTASISTIDLSNIFSAVTFNIGTTGSISATTFFGSGAGLTGINDFYVTGGTYSNGTLTLNRQNGSVTINGLNFTGNTSATCITDLFVLNLNSCSPLHIQPINNGDVYISESGGSVGIGTTNPSSTLHVKGAGTTSGTYSLKVQDSSNRNILSTRNDNFVMAGDNAVSSYLWVNGPSGQFGFSNESGYPYLYLNSSYSNNKFYISNGGSGGSAFAQVNTNLGNWYFSSPNSNVYIASFDDTKVTIVGTGNTSSGFGLKVQSNDGSNKFVVRNDGNVGIGVSSPSETLEVSGKTKTTTLQVTSGATIGYVLTALDSSGNVYWAPTFSGSSSVNTFVTGFTYSNNNLTILQNQGQLPLTVNISSMTGLTINGGLTATTITSTDLSGNGDRIVIASSVGTLSASSQSIIQTYIDPTGTVAGYLDNTSNWDINGIYTGTTITGTYQGQKHYNLNYFFEAVDDNLWIRLIRG